MTTHAKLRELAEKWYGRNPERSDYEAGRNDQRESCAEQLIELLDAEPEWLPMTLKQVLAEWISAGGSHHGPNVETVTMPLSDYVRFRTALQAAIGSQ